MSFLDLDEALVGLFARAELVYGPLVDAKEFPEGVAVTLVEGAVANEENLELLLKIRERSAILVAFGDCAVTGNVTAMRNHIPVPDLLTQVYLAGPGAVPREGEAAELLPQLLPRVLPLHQAVRVDAWLPGCPPSAERVRTAVEALLEGREVLLEASMRSFG